MNEINWNECKSNSFMLVDRTEIHLDQPEYVIRLLVRTMSKLSKRWWGGAVVTAGRGGSCSEKRQTQKRQELFVSVAEIDKQLGRSTGRKMRPKKRNDAICRRHLSVNRCAQVLIGQRGQWNRRFWSRVHWLSFLKIHQTLTYSQSCMSLKNHSFQIIQFPSLWFKEAVNVFKLI